MSEPRKRFRFGLRSFLLVVALFAALFAWGHAVGDRHSAELGLQRSNLESELGRLEKWSTQGHLDLQASSDVSFRKELAKNLARIDADITAMKLKLKELER